MLSAAASLGMVHLWDVDGGLTPIDKFLYTADEHIKSGALLALGIVNCGVRNECDPALALLSDYVLHTSPTLRIGSVLGKKYLRLILISLKNQMFNYFDIIGLGLAYAGTKRDDVIALLLPVLSNPKSTTEVVALAAISCGMIAVGSCDAEVRLLYLLLDNIQTISYVHVLFIRLHRLSFKG